MAPTQVEAQAARSEAIVALAAHQLSSVWPQVDWESPHAPDAVSTLYGGIVTQFGKAAAAVAATQYDELRDAAGVASNYRAEAADPMPLDQVDKAVRSAFLGSSSAVDAPTTTSTLPLEQRVPRRLTTSLQRRVMKPARDTVALNAAQDPGKTRYIRVPRGKSTCAFCIMLASRDIGTAFRGYGAASVRTDKETGLQFLVDSNGARYHNDCDCEAVPLFGRHPDEISPHFKDYRDLYEAGAKAAGTTRDAKAVLAAMRRLPNDGAIEEDRPDVRDRAGENNQRARPLEVHADPDHDVEDLAAEDGGDGQPPTIAERGTNLDQPVDRPDISDALDEIDAADDGNEGVTGDDRGGEVGGEDFADLAEPGSKAPETKLDKALRELSEAMASDADDETIDRLADLADKLQDEVDKAAARREQKRRDIAERIGALIEGGEDPQEAEAQVTGADVESIRRRDFMAQARADGHTGASFEKLLGSLFDTQTDEAFWAAEAATNGFMLKRQYDGKVDPRTLWTVNETTARKYMSDEMAEWFDQHGRITRAILRDMILSGSNIAGRHREDFLR